MQSKSLSESARKKSVSLFYEGISDIRTAPRTFSSFARIHGVSRNAGILQIYIYIRFFLQEKKILSIFFLQWGRGILLFLCLNMHIFSLKLKIGKLKQNCLIERFLRIWLFRLIRFMDHNARFISTVEIKWL